MRFGTLEGEVGGREGAAVTAVLLHGIGLGPWLWEPWNARFHDSGLRTVALRMPGHGPGDEAIGLSEAVEQVAGAVDAVRAAWPSAELVLVGHSMGALVAQVLAPGLALRALALVCPLPAGQVRVVPPLTAVRGALGMVRAFVAGRPIAVGWDAYRRVGLALLEEEVARAVHARIVPWPNALARDLLLRRPVVDPSAVRAPVLVTIGGKDQLVPVQSARLLGDLYEALTWKYDDLGHMAPWEPGGDRMGRDLAAWLAEPARPQVLESEGFGPSEGVGHATRQARRGAEALRRSAYGQRGSKRGD